MVKSILVKHKITIEFAKGSVMEQYENYQIKTSSSKYDYEWKANERLSGEGEQWIKIMKHAIGEQETKLMKQMSEQMTKLCLI